MDRRTFLTGVLATGVTAAGCYALDDGDSDSDDNNDGDSSNTTGDTRQNTSEDNSTTEQNDTAQSDAKNESENETEEGEGEGDNTTDDDSEDDRDPESESQSQDAIDTVEITEHDIAVEEYPEQDYYEIYVTGTLSTGEEPLADVRVDALGYNTDDEQIAHEFRTYARVEANTEMDIEVPLYVEPDRLSSYEVAITNAAYADSA